MPNIRPEGRHANCWRLTTSPDQPWWGRPGDVKRCVHGKLMMRRQVGPRARIAGPGTDWWQTLSPIFDPILYCRARKALT